MTCSLPFKKVGLVEEELREMLTRYGFDGKEAPAVRGSSKLFIDEPDNTSEYGRAAIEKYVYSSVFVC